MIVAGSHNIIHVYGVAVGQLEKQPKKAASDCPEISPPCCSLLLRVGTWARLVARFCCNVVGNND